VKTGADKQEAQNSDLPETIEVHEFATTPAVVHFELPLKKVKDFNSAGISIGISVPCYVEEIDEAITFAKDKVLNRLHAELPEILKLANKLAQA